MNPILFLRRVLALDSLSCLGMGLLMSLDAPTLAPLFGLPESLIRIAGLLLLPSGLIIGWMATRSMPPRPLVWLVIVGNIGWTAESFALLALRDATPFGTAFVTAQAFAWFGLAGFEYIGLKKAVRAAA